MPSPNLGSYRYVYRGYGPWSPWYPGYNAWRFGSPGLRWHYGWYDPYWGWPYDGYSYGYPPRRYVREVDENSYDSRVFGAVRLRVDPKDAKVYVDGALAGIVDEFDGFTDHLRLEAGPHQIELRAEGYETATVTVDVDAGKTRTARVNLKKR